MASPRIWMCQVEFFTRGSAILHTDTLSCYIGAFFRGLVGRVNYGSGSWDGQKPVEYQHRELRLRVAIFLNLHFFSGNRKISTWVLKRKLTIGMCRSQQNDNGWFSRRRRNSVEFSRLSASPFRRWVVAGVRLVERQSHRVLFRVSSLRKLAKLSIPTVFAAKFGPQCESCSS